jgi:hypothetical protein
VTLIAGGADKVISPRQSARLHEAVPESDLHIVSGLGHMVHYETQELIETAVRRAARTPVSAAEVLRSEPAQPAAQAPGRVESSLSS